MQEELHNEDLMRAWNLSKPLATTSANYNDANVFRMCMDEIGELDDTKADAVLAHSALFGELVAVDFLQPEVANAISSLPQEKSFSVTNNYSLSNGFEGAKEGIYLDFPKESVLVSLTDPFSPSEWSTGISDVYGGTFSLGSFENFSESSLEPAGFADGKENGLKYDAPIPATKKSGYCRSASALDTLSKTSLEYANLSQEHDIATTSLSLSPEDKLFWGWFLSNTEHELSEPVSAKLEPVQPLDGSTLTAADPQPEPKLTKMVSVPKHSRAVPKRFVSKGPVDVMVSAIQCLSVVLDYRGYQGEIQRIIVNNNITNVAYNAHDPQQQQKLYSLPINEPFVPDCTMEFVGFPSPNQVPHISNVSGILQRKIYIRNISAVVNAVTLILYVELSKFNINLPYEPQIHRYELDNRGAVVNETKCGLCPFCPTVKFLPFKNSSYLSHLTLEHGVYANSFVVPEVLYYGKYAVTRNVDVQKTRTVKAIQCPACFQVVEVSCWKNKANPLLSYFRHFKKKHQNLTKTFMRSNVDPTLYEK